jgi:hypothetical protein
MSSWLTFFQSYLNPGKLAAVSVPGMVIAFALVLALGPVPCQKQADCPYCSASLKPVRNSADIVKKAKADNPQTFIQGASNSLGAELGDASKLDLTNQIVTFNKDPQPNSATPTGVSALSLIVDPSSAVPGDSSTQASQTKGVLADSCLKLPRYIVPASMSVVDVNDEKALRKAEQSAEKAGVTLYVLDAANNWAPAAPVAQIQSKTVADCNSLLSQIKEGVTLDSKALTLFLTQADQDLATLSSDLITAENAGQTSLVASLQGAIKKKRDYIAWAQKKQAEVGNVQTAEATLEGRVTPLIAVTIAAPTPVTPASPSTVQDVMQTIQDNLIRFLILSLVIGQILDPLQRGAVSFFGPRRDFFIAFNEVYGRNGDGEIRYGDRRLWPWALRNGRPNDDANTAAGRAYSKDKNIYDKNYAIGVGYISQSDAQQIENDWFTQSQLTSGLVIPMVILSLSLGVRAVCCSMNASSNWFWPSVVILFSMPLGIIIGGYLTNLLMHLSSPSYALVAGGLRQWFSTPNADVYVKNHEETLANRHGVHIAMDRTYEDKESRLKDRDKKITRFLVILIVVGVVAVLATIQRPDWWLWDWWPLGWSSNGPTLGSLALIHLPLIAIIPLWVAGLDRLHKYYSELQARIGGNILRLEATADQQVVDVPGNGPSSSAAKGKPAHAPKSSLGVEGSASPQKLGGVQVRAHDDPVVGRGEVSDAGKPADKAGQGGVGKSDDGN